MAGHLSSEVEIRSIVDVHRLDDVQAANKGR